MPNTVPLKYPTSGAARVRFSTCENVELEGQANAFFAFFVLGDRLMSVHRRFNLDLPGLSHLRDRYFSDIVLTTYAVGDQATRPESETVLCRGEDPRVVSDGTRAFVVCRQWVEKGSSVAEYKLVILPEGIERDIIPPAGFKVGKNWQPFLQDGRLFAVHSFAPLTVLAIDESGQARVVHQAPTEYWLPAPHDRYTMVRGGSNAVTSNGLVIGFGHLTVTRDDHRPFVWTLDQSMRMTLSMPDAFLGLRAKGFNIVDPTSLFSFDGHLHFGLCASEREWFFGQRFLNLLVELPCTEASSLCDAGQAEVFATLADEVLTFLPASHTFVPRDMPHQVPTHEIHGGVESQGEPGCLLHGPYHPINTEGFYLATLSYLARGVPRSGLAGRFEVSCYREGEVLTLAAMDIAGTDSRAATASLPFSTHGRVGWLLETRLFVEQGIALNALSIRVLETGTR